MKVLLVLVDLYKEIGGGQAVYKKIIEASPEIEFFYFRDLERADTVKPGNVHSIPLSASLNLKTQTPPPAPTYLNSLQDANRFARSVAGEIFDLVDIPDFYIFGSFLRAVFSHHNVKVGRIVLAMHGNISKSMELGWGSTCTDMLECRGLESRQFDSVDAIYAISRRYIREWQSVIKREVYYIDPAYFVTAEIRRYKKSARPTLYCIGRSERRKGNDLFVELVRWLKQKTFNSAAHVGNSDYSDQGINSTQCLSNIARQRDLKIDFISALDRGQLNILYSSDSIVLLPVRYDTLNLVALEALFSGCPVAISSGAGVCDYLDEEHPGLPYIKINLDNFYAAVEEIQELVNNYEQHRAELNDYLVKYPPKPTSPLKMGSIYQAVLDSPAHKQDMELLSYEEKGQLRMKILARLARFVLPLANYHGLRNLILQPLKVIRNYIKQSKILSNAKFNLAMLNAFLLPRRFKIIQGKVENDLISLRGKLGAIYDKASSPIFRCNFWMDIARIERIRGNELMAVTYELRIIRLLGEDRLEMLPRIVNTLNQLGFIQEALAAQAMFTDPPNAEKKVYAYLKEAFQRNLNRKEKPFQIIDDRRNVLPVKVAVIVSLYNAADKLNLFLAALCNQTLIKLGEVEIILIDSGSPSDERKVIESFLQKTPLNVVYARSEERETIQSAWNRGIGLAKAPNLVFLGVDETLYPEALELLATELDQNPEVDWVMANSLVTAVEENGVFRNDIMNYDRTGGTKDHVYLETCYLSWVGGMYRKSLHERFGYYDETFGAAGDTEIKNRILPYINVKFIPKTLGIFLNYPDGQTTASPKAEIEDLRAWYLHRTLGGVRYAFENRSLDDANKMMCAALGYRKSYCGHMSCDIEYASYLAKYICAENKELGVVLSVSRGLEKMLVRLRGLEFTDRNPSRLGSIFLVLGAWRNAAQCQKEHREALRNISWPYYKVLNDNRYEQHSWLWKSV